MKIAYYSDKKKGEIDINNYEYIQIEVIENNIASLKINRPEVMNALNKKVVQELIDAITLLEQNESIQCVILAGDTNYFIAGADIRELNGMSVHEAYHFSQALKEIYEKISFSTKPYIAAISGYCLGSGFELALACDIRLASFNAKFGFPEINLGIIPGGGGIQRLKQLTGTSLASEFIMTGKVIDASDAKELKIVNSLSKEVFTSALSLARQIVSKSSNAISAIKKLLNGRDYRDLASMFEEDIHQFSMLFDYADAYEGMSAFIEKRQPLFSKQE